MTTHFELTFKAAVGMLVLPSLTNIYYALRPHSILSGIMPLAVPLLCFANYVYFVNRDFQQYCLIDDPDAEEARKQYDILYEFSYFSSVQNELMTKIQNFRRDHSDKP
jgi:hypothetical protein